MHYEIESLDEIVLRLPRLFRGPEYQRQLLRDIPEVSGLAGLRVLRAIERCQSTGNAPTVKDVAADLGIEHSTASRTVHAAVTSGLVDKTTCASDQRKARLALTTAGRRVLSDATRNRRAILTEILAAWTPEDIDMLTTLLHRLVAGYDAREVTTRP